MADDILDVYMDWFFSWMGAQMDWWFNECSVFLKGCGWIFEWMWINGLMNADWFLNGSRWVCISFF